MSVRYVVNAFALVAAAFVVVASQTFGATPLTWLAFGVSVAVVLAALAGIGVTRRVRGSAGYAALAVVGAWSVVAALVFSGSTLTWLIFADALGVAAVALAALTAHEITTERVVHTLEVHDSHSAQLV